MADFTLQGLQAEKVRRSELGALREEKARRSLVRGQVSDGTIGTQSFVGNNEIQGPPEGLSPFEKAMLTFGSGKRGQGISELFDLTPLRLKPEEEFDPRTPQVVEIAQNFAKQFLRGPFEIAAQATNRPDEVLSGLARMIPEGFRAATQAAGVLSPPPDKTLPPTNDLNERARRITEERRRPTDPEVQKAAQAELKQSPGTVGFPLLMAFGGARGLAKRTKVAPKPVAVEPVPAPAIRPKLEVAEKQGALGKIKQPFEQTVFRGTSGRGPTDPGDLGIGTYYTTHKPTAKQFGVVSDKSIKLNNPLRITGKEAGELALEYGTLKGSATERRASAKRLTSDLQQQGFDGIIASGYETPLTHQTILKFPDLVQKTPTGIEPPVKVITRKEATETFGFLGANPEVLKGIGETAVRGAREVAKATDELVLKAKDLPEIKEGVAEAKKSMIQHDRQIRNAEFTNKQLEKTVNDAIPKPDRQMLMVQAYETKMTGKFWKELKPEEKAMVQWAAKEKAKLNKFIQDNKILEMMKQKDVNHIFHHWINPKTGKPYEAMFGKFSKGLPQAKQRTIPTYEKGIAVGLKPATTNLGKLIGLEWEAAMRAHSTRQMIKSLHNIKAESGTQIRLTNKGPLRDIRMIERWDKVQDQGLTDNYTRYSHYALDKAITFKDANGNFVRLQGAIAVRNELFPFLKAYVENPVFNNYDKLNFASKSLKLGMSLFHVMSLGLQEVANFRPPFTNIPRGLKLRRSLGPEMKTLHREGLDLFKGYEDVGFRNQFFEGVNWSGKLGNKVTWPVKVMRDFIFDVVQPGMKASFAYDMYNKMLPKYEKAGKMHLLARDVVNKADGHFSGEHYKRSLLETNRFMVKLYFMPEARVWWQRALLSPTWQREHLLVAKNVAKSFMPDRLIKRLGLAEIGPIKSQYRKYALGATLMIGSVDLYNYMMTLEMDGKGKHLWENPKGFGFSARLPYNEPDYTIVDKNGKKRTIKGGAAYFRPLKSVFEIAEWGAKPVKKLAYKLSPFWSALIKQINPGTYDEKYEGLEDMPRRLRDVIFEVGTPITIDQYMRYANDEKRLISVILPSIGFPTSKFKRKKNTQSLGPQR